MRKTYVSNQEAASLRGLEGERLALAYLTSCGWSIEAHRFKLGKHDIDLITRRAGVVAFVEVTTKRGVAAGSPVDKLTKRKQVIVGKVAALWALRFGRRDDVYRFDQVGVHIHKGGRVEIEHVEDAWRL